MPKRRGRIEMTADEIQNQLDPPQRGPVRPILCCALGALITMTVACSGSDRSDDNRLERIDGPAQVDPDYDPSSETVAPSGDVDATVATDVAPGDVTTGG